MPWHIEVDDDGDVHVYETLPGGELPVTAMMSRAEMSQGGMTDPQNWARLGRSCVVISGELVEPDRGRKVKDIQIQACAVRVRFDDDSETRLTLRTPEEAKATAKTLSDSMEWAK